MTSGSLAQALQVQHEATMIRQAETIRDWPSPPERQQQAEIFVRLTLWERGLGRISDETRRRIYAILNFVMPNDATFADVAMPLPELEKEAASLAAYHEQLARQSCPECGEGLCPVENEIRLPHDQ